MCSVFPFPHAPNLNEISNPAKKNKRTVDKKCAVFEILIKILLHNFFAKVQLRLMGIFVKIQVGGVGEGKNPAHFLSHLYVRFFLNSNTRSISCVFHFFHEWKPV